ncbi:MAG: amino acid ABC transporter substrate-binding protein [Motiliproteus sp.]
MKIFVLLMAMTIITGCASSQNGRNYTDSTLETVKKRGHLNCGVSTGLPGFSAKDKTGKWVGLDVDVCRATAAAVLGNSEQVRYIPLRAKKRFTALQSGEIDLLSRNSSLTQTRDTRLGLNATAVTYYDGQGVMVSKNLGANSIDDLDGATACLQQNTSSKYNLISYFQKHRISYSEKVFNTTKDLTNAFNEGECDLVTSDQSQLYYFKLTLKNPESVVILPETITLEPLAPYVRQGDDQWLDIVRWSQSAMVNAEELGLTSTNIDNRKNDLHPAIQLFVGSVRPLGKDLFLQDDWAFQIVRQVGNYSESFERNVGSESIFKIPRGHNALWKNGGMQYAPPMR